MVLHTEPQDLPGSSSSSSSTHNRYDVFLSFRGVDTRERFTAYLYDALIEADFKIFLDDEEIETGQSLKPELESAIESSRASIIVLSKNYASSTWCLDELVLILEQTRNFNQIVIPIFYHVEPTDVRKQQNSFGEAMAEYKKRMETEANAEKRSEWGRKIESWKRALTEVSNLKGKDAKGRSEPKLIEEIVNNISGRLVVPLETSDLRLPFERKDHVERITSWLKDGSSHTADFLTIWGMGGIGKTYLAKYIFELHRHEYASSFVGDISRRCAATYTGLLDLQKQLCDDISKRSSKQVHDVSQYTYKIVKALALKKVLLVLDGVDSLDQLDSLLGDKGFYPGSKIIITTRDKSLIESCELFKTKVKPKHMVCKLEVLSMNASLKLFCHHAFTHKYPNEGYEEVSKKLATYCEGHPLALEILGKSLYNQVVGEWEDCIEFLKKEPASSIKNKILQRSFDSLELENDKELFKHIACFFVGTDRSVTETILNACGVNTKLGIGNLIDKCLLSIARNNKLMMHQLVQEKGRDLVRQESPEKPWKRSRLWCHEESFDVLERKKGTENIIGLALDMKMIEERKSQLETDALSKMDNLKLLQLNYVKINGSYKNISKKLRWLCMHGFHLESIPTELQMENLVVLDMSHSKIESFDMSFNISQRFVSRPKGLFESSSENKPLLGSLKILDLRFCEQLHNLGGFQELPALEKLIISNCTRLIQVCESVEYCVKLLFIDLSNCKKLKKLPGSIGKLKKLERLLSNGCNILVFPTEMRDMDSLQKIVAENMGINSQTSSSTSVELIPRDLRSFLSCFPISLRKLSLANNNLSNEFFPMDFSSLSMLKNLYLDGNPIVSMPSCVRSLPSLQMLSMSNCELLETVVHPPSSLRQLRLGDLVSLREMKFNPDMSPLALFLHTVRECSMVIEGIIKIQPLARVKGEVLRRLGWANFELIKCLHLMNSQQQKFNIQMYYEFGIFSTIYGGRKMPSWISRTSNGSSISFSIPYTLNKLRGFNFCYVLEKLSNSDKSFNMPLIIVSNKTKKGTWIYEPYISKVNVAEQRLIFLSHWMFGKNEIEDGDEVNIFITNRSAYEVGSIKECGIDLVYDEKNEEEDVLGSVKKKERKKMR